MSLGGNVGGISGLTIDPPRKLVLPRLCAWRCQWVHVDMCGPVRTHPRSLTPCRVGQISQRHAGLTRRRRREKVTTRGTGPGIRPGRRIRLRPCGVAVSVARRDGRCCTSRKRREGLPGRTDRRPTTTAERGRRRSRHVCISGRVSDRRTRLGQGSPGESLFSRRMTFAGLLP